MAESQGDLRLGFPCPIAIKSAADLLKESATMIDMADEEKYGPSLCYGAAAGDDFPRDVISSFLSDEYNEPVPKDQVFLSGGSSLSLFVLGHQLVPANCKFLIEEVTFFLAINVIKNDLHREVVSINLAPGGLDLEDLEKKLKVEYNACPDDQQYSCALYIIPTFHNPRGICYDGETSIEVAKLSKKYKALVICDDVYNILYYEGEQIPRRLRSYAIEAGCSDNVVSVGSFSKICAPGLRLGWIECSLNVFAQLNNLWTLVSGCNFGQYHSYIIANAIKSGRLKKHIRELRCLYRKRVDFVVEELKAGLPDGSIIEKPKGGYFVWVQFPINFDTTKLLKISKEKYGLAFHLGERFCVCGGYQNCIRLSISYLQMSELRIAISNLLKAVQDYHTTH